MDRSATGGRQLDALLRISSLRLTSHSESGASNSGVDLDRASFAGVETRWLFEGPVISIGRWRCTADAAQRGLEKQQLWHDISFVHHGSYELSAPSGADLADTTSIVYLNPFMPYRTAHPCGCGDRGSTLKIREDVLRDLLAERDPGAVDRPGGLFPRHHALGSSRVHVAQRLLTQRLAGGTPAEPLAVEEAALNIVAGALDSLLGPPARARPASAGTRKRHRDQVRAVREILQQRYTESLHLDDLASAVGLSVHHLCRVFRREAGVPVHRYLTRLRLCHALAAAADGVADLTRLALDLGFSSHSHFTAAFRREFSIPPSLVRRLAGPPVAPTAGAGRRSPRRGLRPTRSTSGGTGAPGGPAFRPRLPPFDHRQSQ